MFSVLMFVSSFVILLGTEAGMFETCHVIGLICGCRNDKLESEAASSPQPRPKTIKALMRCIEQDFERGYIITGKLA